MSKEIRRPGDQGMRTNNPEWREARPIPDTLVEDTEIVEREVRVAYHGEGPFSVDFVEMIFKNGIDVAADRVASVTVRETVETTFRRSKLA